MIELSPNLHLISEDEFAQNGRGDYNTILVGKFNLRDNLVEAKLAPPLWGTDPEPGYDELFVREGNKFKLNGVNFSKRNPYYDTFVTTLVSQPQLTGGNSHIYDTDTGEWYLGPEAHYDGDDKGNILIHYKNRLNGVVSDSVKLPASAKPSEKIAVVIDAISLQRIDRKTQTVTLLNEGAVAVSHVLVGVGVDFPRYLSRNTRRAAQYDTPFYKAYEMPTAKLPQGLIDDFGVELSPSMLDMKRMTEWLATNNFEDDRLHEDQIEAVNVHLSTNVGFVNAMQAGDGKTISTLVGLDARSQALQGAYRSLVVLEAGVRKQWEDEAAEWLPAGWDIARVNSRSDTDTLREAIEKNQANDSNLLVLCSYNLAADAEAEETELGQILARTTFNDVVADEGKTIRGFNKTARALWKIRRNSDVGIVLCATPVLKSPDDLARLMAWARCDENIYGSHIKELFRFDSDAPLDELADWYAWWGPTLCRSTTSREKRAENMQRPSVKTVVEEVQPTQYEIHISEMILGKVRDTLQNIIDTYKRMGENLTPEEEQQLRGAILATQGVARQAASDVRGLAKSDSAIAHLLRAEGVFEFPQGFIPAKMERCIQRCQEFNESIVVFTDYQETAKAMCKELNDRGVPSALFIGTGIAKRDKDLEAFNNGDIKVLVCTSAAERGLNLQTARYVIHYDHKFTPDAIFQRTGRVTRIGSVYNEVEALFLVTANTVDEKVFSVAVARAGLAGATAAKSAEDFAESDQAAMLKTLIRHAKAVRLANRSQVSQLELTKALVD